ncbi:hypothetical protein ABE10_02960, partial [Bacillus toyonensis]|nr:hypothetical protein [Bacillus toyonensis]
MTETTRAPVARSAGALRSSWSADGDEVDDEDQGLAAEEVSRSGGAVRQVRRDDQLATSADLHAGDPVLPALDQTAQRELDRLAPSPRRVELLSGVELDAGVVHGHGVAGLGLVAAPFDDVADDQLGGSGTGGGIELRLGALSHG